MTTNIYDFTKKIIKFYFVWLLSLLWNLLITYIVTDMIWYEYNWSLLCIIIYNLTVIFYLQKCFTFKNKSKKEIKKQIIYFFILLIINIIALKIFAPILNKVIPNYTTCTLIVSWVMTIINFIIQNFFIFNNRKWQKSLSQ